MVDFGGGRPRGARSPVRGDGGHRHLGHGGVEFGIPTSESHALIAGLSGAAIALHNGLSGINGAEWLKGHLWPGALYAAGLRAGLHRGKDRRFPLQICGAAEGQQGFPRGADWRRSGHGLHARRAGWSEVHWRVPPRHGALQRPREMGTVEIPIWLMALCAIVMGLGTSFGGLRIIKSVGMDMVKLDVHQAFPRILPRRAACCSLP